MPFRKYLCIYDKNYWGKEYLYFNKYYILKMFNEFIYVKLLHFLLGIKKQLQNKILNTKVRRLCLALLFQVYTLYSSYIQID